MRVWFSPTYPDKLRRAAARLKKSGVVRASEFVEPEPASELVLRRVHDEAWVRRCLDGALTPQDVALVERPCPPEEVLQQRRHVQGTVEACRDALKTGVGLHCGGGGHHAFADRGTGYCLFNDLAIGVRSVLSEAVARVAVVDLDVHQGNGTAAIFRGEGRIYTFSMHQADLYPDVKVHGSHDIALAAGTGDEDYLGRLRSALSLVLDRMRPDLVIYQAGVDSYEGDPKGGLKLTKAGLEKRDRFVLRSCRERGVPVAVTLGGGYSDDAPELHAATLAIAVESAKASTGGRP